MLKIMEDSEVSVIYIYIYKLKLSFIVRTSNYSAVIINERSVKCTRTVLRSEINISTQKIH